MPSFVTSAAALELVLNEVAINFGLSASALKQSPCSNIKLASDRLCQLLTILFVVCRAKGLSFTLRFDRKLPAKLTIQLIDTSLQTKCLVLMLVDTNGRLSHKASKSRAWRCVQNTTALIGPDGSGKTALVEEFRKTRLGQRYQYQRFKRFFRRVLFHVRKSRDRNDLESKHPGLILPVAWPYFLWSRKISNRFRQVILDRYFYDYFLRDLRSKSVLPVRVKHYDWCTKYVPIPSRLVIAMCGSKTIYQRKPEIQPEAIELLYRVYLEQIASSRPEHVLFCHTGLALSVSSQHFERFMESD